MHKHVLSASAAFAAVAIAAGAFAVAMTSSLAELGNAVHSPLGVAFGALFLAAIIPAFFVGIHKLATRHKGQDLS